MTGPEATGLPSPFLDSWGPGAGARGGRLGAWLSPSPGRMATRFPGAMVSLGGGT